MNDQGQLLQFGLLDGDRHELTIPFRPKSKNVWEGWNHMYRAGERKKWAKHLDAQLAEMGLRCEHEGHPPHPTHHRDRPNRCPNPLYPAVMVEATLVFKSKRSRDWQNYVHPLYWFLADALVRAGVIRDDTPDCFNVESNGGIRFRIDSTTYHRDRTIVTITPFE